MLACLAGWSLLGGSGCIPAFRGLGVVPQAQLKPKKKSKAPAEILNEDIYYRVQHGQVGQFGMSTFKRRYARIRINNKKGMGAATFTLSGGKLTALQVRTTCPDGRVTKMGLKDIQLATKDRTYGSLYSWSSNFYKFTAPGVSVGCVIDFMYELDRPGDSSQMTWSIMRGTWPVKKSKFTYEYGPRQTLRTVLRNMDGLWLMIQQKRQAEAKKKSKGEKTPVVVLTKADKAKHVTIKHDKGARRIQMTLKDIPGRPRKWSQMAAKRLYHWRFRRSAVCSIELVSTGGLNPREHRAAWKNIDASFNGKRAWFWDTRSMRQRFFQIDEEEELRKDGLADIARKLTRNMRQRESKLRTIHEHVRRRMILTSGRLSPNLSTSRKLLRVYKLKRGTQVEINMIMVIMLRAVGVRAYPGFLQKHDKRYQQRPPSQSFNQSVVYVAPIAEGKWKGLRMERALAERYLSSKGPGYQGGRKVEAGRIFNPSRKFLPFDVRMAAYTGAWTFVVDGAGGRFFSQKAPKNYGSIKRIWKLQAQPDGTLTGTVKLIATGNQSVVQRERFHRVPKRLWNERSVGWSRFSACTREAEVELSTMPNLDMANLKQPFVFEHKVTMKHCLPHAKKGLIFRGWLYRGMNHSLAKAERTIPVYLGPPVKRGYEVHITFPSGYRPMMKSLTKDLSAPGLVGTMKREFKGSTLSLVGSVANMRDQLPPSSYEKVRTFFNAFKGLTRPVFVVAGR